MRLIERESCLQTLTAMLAEAATGSGRTALVSGEAGIGKSALIERFTQGQSARVLWGGCEALFTPRPLGPLLDIVYQLRGGLLESFSNGTPRSAIFADFLEELRLRPSIVIFEDVHWADEATLDLIKFLGRRVAQVPALFILSYREEDLSTKQGLRLVLGDLPNASTKRLTLAPLSTAAVAALAGAAGRSAATLHAVTGGNPFFVTEVLASAGAAIPSTVRDAVLARASQLTEAARRVVEFAAIVPGQIEQWLVDALLHPQAGVIDECLERGMLHVDGEALAFRHELARLAIKDSLSPIERKAMHKAILDALMVRGDEATPLSRLVHHAAGARDTTAVLRYAPAAAAQATALSTHHEAVQHYLTSMEFAPSADDDTRAGLLEKLGAEYALTNQVQEGVQTYEQAHELRRRQKDPVKLARNLTHLSLQHLQTGYRAEAMREIAEAIALLEGLPPCGDLAMAYAQQSRLRMVVGELEAAIMWGGRAIELASGLGNVEVLVHALNTVGSTEFFSGQIAGREKLEKSLELARAHGFDLHTARAYANLCYAASFNRAYPLAERAANEGIAFCAAHDLDRVAGGLATVKLWCKLELGRWPPDDDLERSLAGENMTAIRKGQILWLSGLLRLRRGNPGATALLAKARELALSAVDAIQLRKLLTASAEAAWLAGNAGQCGIEAQQACKAAQEVKNPWFIGEAAYWLWRAGQLDDCPENAALPYRLQIAGDWRGAADEWESIGCPYERAMALMDGDEPAQREALSIFEGLGAQPAAAMVRRRLQEQGLRIQPRGLNASTRENPAGLTARELEVLELMAEGLANPDIARKLYRSAKTVEHHVSAVLAKLGAASRMEAVTLARDRKILPIRKA